MRVTTILLGLASLSAAAKLKPRRGPKGPTRDTSYATKNTLSLAVRQSCSIGFTSCDSDYCIPDDGQCCYDGFGNYCPDGSYCDKGGCCDDGEICTSGIDNDDDLGDIIECDTGEEKCGYLCMPAGSKCCDEDIGMYCASYETCGDVFCESDIGGSGSNSISDDDDDVGSTLCKRKGGKGGGDGGGHFGGGDDDGDGCGDAAGMLGVPVLLVGLAAALPLFL